MPILWFECIFAYLIVMLKMLYDLVEYVQVDSSADKKPDADQASGETLHNPARVVTPQEKYIRFPEGSRYVPLKATPSGFVMLKDLQPSEIEILVSTDTPATAASGTTSNTQAAQSNIIADEAEPQPPQPFEYVS